MICECCKEEIKEAEHKRQKQLYDDTMKRLKLIGVDTGWQYAVVVSLALEIERYRDKIKHMESHIYSLGDNHE